MTLTRARKSGKKYLNPVPSTIGGFSTVFKVLPEYLFGKEEREPKQPLGPFPTDASVYASAPASGLRVTWFGHSSSLVELDGFRILIDPIWEERASPLQWMGPKRFFPPTLPLESLPTLDVILISHDHYDHLGAETVAHLARLQPQARWVTSLVVGKLLQQFGAAPQQITELDWTESHQIGSLRITAWPARHFSGRGLTNRFHSLWSSFVLEGPQHRVYYGADSGYWDGFSEISAKYAEHYPSFDLVMLEIGAFSELWADIHLGPDNATRAFEAMGENATAGMLMPIHWGLFNLALHAWRQPIARLLELVADKGLQLWSPRPGEPTEVVRGEARWSDWWRSGN